MRLRGSPRGPRVRPGCGSVISTHERPPASERIRERHRDVGSAAARRRARRRSRAGAPRAPLSPPGRPPIRVPPPVRDLPSERSIGVVYPNLFRVVASPHERPRRPGCRPARAPSARGPAVRGLPRGHAPARQRRGLRHPARAARLLADAQGAQAGWKIGCTTPTMQEYLGIHEPAAGHIRRRRCRRAGAVVHDADSAGRASSASWRFGSRATRAGRRPRPGDGGGRRRDGGDRDRRRSLRRLALARRADADGRRLLRRGLRARARRRRVARPRPRPWCRRRWP